MLSTNFSILLFLTTTSLLLSSSSVLSNPLTNGSNLKADLAPDSLEELNDLNEQSEDSAYSTDGESQEYSADRSSFSHHDEDLPRNPEMDKNLKYDVEILESSESKKENNEIEEQFKGAAIKMNTDTFVAENIEVSGGDDSSKVVMLPQSHMALTIILVIVALLSIGLYAALVIWRAHLEQRYGMRELLVTNDIDEEFCQQQQQQRSDNSDNSSSRGTATAGGDSNNRHFILGQA